MNKNTGAWFIVFSVIALNAAAFMVAKKQRDDLKAEAVKHGAAEWVVDVNGNTTFKWKENQ